MRTDILIGWIFYAKEAPKTSYRKFLSFFEAGAPPTSPTKTVCFGRIQFPLFEVSVRPLLTASSHGDATAPTIPCDDAVRHFPSRRCRVKFVVKGLLINVVEGI